MTHDHSTARAQESRVLRLGIVLAGLAQPAAASDGVILGKVAPEVLSQEQRGTAAGMIHRDIRRRTAEANARNRAEWGKIQTREQWERYRDERIDRLRRSLGD